MVTPQRQVGVCEIKVFHVIVYGLVERERVAVQSRREAHFFRLEVTASLVVRTPPRALLLTVRRHSLVTRAPIRDDMFVFASSARRLDAQRIHRHGFGDYGRAWQVRDLDDHLCSLFLRLVNRAQDIDVRIRMACNSGSKELEGMALVRSQEHLNRQLSCFNALC